MSTAKNGDTVRVSYIGTLPDGSVFDQTDEDILEFTIGAHQLISGFEQAVIGMAVGETKKVTIPPEQGYGTYDEERIVEVSRSRLPDNVEPELGQVFEAQSNSGSPIFVTVKAVSEGTVTLDANHMLAGKDLIFEITLEEIV